MENGITRKRGNGKLQKALKALELEKGTGMLTPQEVLDEARNPSSVLHDSFEWDDKVGGEKYRLMQARVLLNNVRVEFMGESQKGFLNATVKIDSVPVRGYFGVETVAQVDEIYKSVLKKAVYEIEYANNKYKHLKELKGVIDTEELEALKVSLEA